MLYSTQQIPVSCVLCLSLEGTLYLAWRPDIVKNVGHNWALAGLVSAIKVHVMVSVLQ